MSDIIAHPDPASAIARGLPKWPQMRVTGAPITTEQAKEVIRRTDTFFTCGYGGNNSAYNLWVWQAMGFVADADSHCARVMLKGTPSHVEYDLMDAWRKEWGCLYTEYVSNSWISCAFIGGPHGWCHPDGQIRFGDNVGRWPDIAEIIAEWESITAAFPFVEPNVTLMDGESCEDGTRRVIAFTSRGGESVICADDYDPHRGDEPSPSGMRDLFSRSRSDGRRGAENGIPDEWVAEWAPRSREILAKLRTVVDNLRRTGYGRRTRGRMKKMARRKKTGLPEMPPMAPRAPVAPEDINVAAKGALKRKLLKTKQLQKGAANGVRVPDGAVYLIDFDVEWAELLLANLHPRQRRPSEKHIDEIVRALKEERFLWLGDPLRIDADGLYVDGIHRGYAVIKSGITIPNQILVQTNEPDALLYIDALHKARSLKDVQRLHGLKVAHTSVDAGILFAEAKFPSWEVKTRPSKPELAMMIQNYPFFEEVAALHAKSCSSGVALTRGPIAAMAACFRVDREASMEFWTAVASNMEEYPEIQQARTFVQWFLRAKNLRGRTSSRDFTYESADKAIRAWNAWREGVEITKLQRSRDPDNVATPI